MMQVFVNGAAHKVPNDSNLADLLERLQVMPTACATAVNGVFVARSARSATVLHDQDQIMTFEPITGG